MTLGEFLRGIGALDLLPSLSNPCWHWRLILFLLLISFTIPSGPTRRIGLVLSLTINNNELNCNYTVAQAIIIITSCKSEAGSGYYYKYELTIVNYRCA